MEEQNSIIIIGSLDMSLNLPCDKCIVDSMCKEFCENYDIYTRNMIKEFHAKDARDKPFGIIRYPLYLELVERSVSRELRFMRWLNVVRDKQIGRQPM